MEEPPGKSGTKGPLYKGEKGRGWILFEVNFLRFLLDKHPNIMAASNAPWRFNLLRTHMHPEYGVHMEVQLKAQELVEKHTQAPDPTAEEEAQLPEVDYVAAYDGLLKYLRDKYGVPAAEQIAEFTELVPREGDTLEQWGAMLLGHYRILAKHGQATPGHAYGIYLDGLPAKLRDRVESANLGDFPTSPEEVEERVLQVEKLASSLSLHATYTRTHNSTGRGGKATGGADASALLKEQLTGKKGIRQLQSLLQQQGLKITSANDAAGPSISPSSASSRAQGNPKGCLLHGPDSTHSTDDCRELKRSLGLAQPRAMAASFSPPGAQQGTRQQQQLGQRQQQQQPWQRQQQQQGCTYCGDQRHREDDCWKKFPEKAPWNRSGGRQPPVGAAYAQMERKFDQLAGMVAKIMEWGGPSSAFPASAAARAAGPTAPTLNPRVGRRVTFAETDGPRSASAAPAAAVPAGPHSQAQQQQPAFDPWAPDHNACAAQLCHHWQALPARQVLPRSFEVLPPTLEKTRGSHAPSDGTASPSDVTPLPYNKHFDQRLHRITEIDVDICSHVDELLKKVKGRAELMHEHLKHTANRIAALQPMPAEKSSQPALASAPGQPAPASLAGQPANAALPTSEHTTTDQPSEGPLQPAQPASSQPAKAAPAATANAHQVSPEWKDKMEVMDVTNSASWFISSDTPAKGGFRVMHNGVPLPAPNCMPDTGAGVLVASREWCDRVGLSYSLSSVPLSGCGGQGAAVGTLVSAIDLVCFGGTPHEFRMTVGGKHTQVLITEGTSALYDLLVGYPFLRPAGAIIDTLQDVMLVRPRYRASEGRDTRTFPIPLRAHPRPAGVHIVCRVAQGSASTARVPTAAGDHIMTEQGISAVLTATPPDGAGGTASPATRPVTKTTETSRDGTPVPAPLTAPTRRTTDATHDWGPPPRPAPSFLQRAAPWLLLVVMAILVGMVAGAAPLPSLALLGILPAALVKLACTAYPPIPPSFVLRYPPARRRPRKRARGRIAARWHTAGGGMHCKPTRFKLLRYALVAVCFLGAVQSVAAGTAWLLGAEGCQVAASNQNCIALAAHHAQYTPSSLVQAHMPSGSQAMIGDHLYTKDEENGWTWGNHPEATPDEHRELREVVAACRGAFAYSTADLPGYHGEMGPFRLKLNTSEPIITPQRRYSPVERQVTNEKMGELYEVNIVRESFNPRYISALVVAAKKDADGNWTDKRVCTDTRSINTHTERDRYAPRLPDEMFQEIGASRFFTKIDLRAGFHQIPIAEEDQEKTTFWWGNRTFCYTRLCFGLTNATAHFQRVMDYEISKASMQDNVCCFVDDILVHSRTHGEHVAHVRSALQMLQGCGLRAHPDKSVFGAASVEFLGHVVSPYGMSPHAAKVAAIRELPTPTCLPDLRSVLGFCNYYRCYVPNYSAIVQPINKLLSKDVPWSWGPECAQAFRELKDELCREGRALRRAEPDKPYVLYTDWSKQGIGAVLAQVHDNGKEYMVACISRSLNKHEANYSSYEGEALACVWACKTLRPYLHGASFSIVTDHQPLCYLMTNQSLTGKHARWALSLQEYEFQVIHRPGKSHQNADVPSRFPRGSAFDGTGARLDGLPDDPPAPFPDPTRPPTSELIKAAAHVARQPLPPQLEETDDETDEPMTSPPAAAAPRIEELLEGNLHAHDSDQYVEITATHPHAAGLRKAAREAALLAAPLNATAANASAPAANADPAPPQPQQRKLRTSPVPPSFYTAALTTGIILVELCGGMNAGLEAALRNGMVIKDYLYADTDPVARRLTEHRLLDLHAQYPNQLPHGLQNTAFRIPQDVRKLTRAQLQGVEAAFPDTPWLVVAGWPCQDLSPAGSGKGLEGGQSNLFYDVHRVLTDLQEVATGPVGYLLENAAMQYNFNHTSLRDTAYRELVAHLGEPACLDAARFNSHAHRLRNYWSNLAIMTHVQRAADCHQRAPGLLVDQILDPGRHAQLARRNDAPPFYPANAAGAPLSALPTIVAFPSSHAYRNGGIGMVWDDGMQALTEPNADERERALGYLTGTTAAPGLNERQRRHLLGNCIDQNLLQTLLALCRSVTLLSPAPTQPALVSVIPCYPLGGGYVSSTSVQPECSGQPEHQQQSARNQGDVWEDAAAMHYLRHGTMATAAPAAEARRVQRRAAAYVLIGGSLFRNFQDDSRKEVPHPNHRQALVEAAHCGTGHFGVNRTISMLKVKYWWYGMGQDVARWVSQCELCARLHNSFDAPTSELNPLPLHGMFYRWGVDLAGPLPKTSTGNTFVMVCIEHFSKHLVLCPIPSKEPACTAAAFLTHVLGSYGACAEVLTDGGGEFQGAFDALLRDSMIDHRVTRPNNPQADGLAERAVQTFKRALSKSIEQAQDATNWDTQLLPWIALGYNTSKQQSTGFSPYYLMHGVEPVVPPAIKERLEEPLDVLQPERAVELLQVRAAAMQQAGVIAFANLRVAQQRDTLRYATVRSGTYHPRLRRYRVGDYVYVRVGQPNNTLDMSHFKHILRVAEITPQGNLVLKGSCDRVMTTNVTNVAPCHLTNINPARSEGPAKPSPDLPCEICGFPDREDVMLLCDACETGWHIDCLTPALPAVPEGDDPWVCPRCEEAGVSPDELTPPQQPLPDPKRQAVIPSAQKRRSDKVAAALDGRRVKVGRRLGTARFTGVERRPRYFDIEYDDGKREVSLSTTFVRNRLLPAGGMACVLPGTWALHTPEGVSTALQQLMPGLWDQGHLTKLAGKIACTYADPQSAPHTPTKHAEVRALCQLLDLSQLGVVLDPWAGDGAIRRELSKTGVPVVDNDLNPERPTSMHGDALQPDFYRAVETRAPVDAVVTSPWFAILDLALPLAVSAARVVACVHVPGHYVSDAHPARAKYLAALMRAGRLHILWNLPKGPMGRRCAWLLVFASPLIKKCLVSKETWPISTHSYAAY